MILVCQSFKLALQSTVTVCGLYFFKFTKTVKIQRHNNLKLNLDAKNLLMEKISLNWKNISEPQIDIILTNWLF